MGGGGDGSQDSTVYQYALSPIQEPYFGRMMDRGEGVSNTPYTPYPNQRLASFTPDMEEYFSGVRGQYGRGTPGVANAGAIAEAATIGALGQGGAYDPQAFYSGQWNPEAMDQYMNPYIGGVLDTQKERLQQRFDEQQQSRNAAQVNAGAYGGDRRYVENSIAQREMNMQQNEIEQQGMQQAYQAAFEGYDKDRLASLEAQRLHDASRQFSQQQAMQGLELGLSGAQQMANTEELNQSLAYQRLGAMKDAGLTNQAWQQEAMNIGYTDFENQRDYERGQLQFLNSILRGVPISATSSVTQNAADPNFLSQLAGLGVGIYGLQQSGAFG